MPVRLLLTVACLALASCAPAPVKQTSSDGASPQRRVAPSPEERERQEKYIWYSELAQL
jgi:hypothetical protein